MQIDQELIRDTLFKKTKTNIYNVCKCVWAGEGVTMVTHVHSLGLWRLYCVPKSLVISNRLTLLNTATLDFYNHLTWHNFINHLKKNLFKKFYFKNTRYFENACCHDLKKTFTCIKIKLGRSGLNFLMWCNVDNSTVALPCVVGSYGILFWQRVQDQISQCF